ncbi:AEC family transporter [Alteribacillus sp. YIM 98480]|uniref:AEC family transporter n=1 Tax=Alteribacillus sp. YIM 98480 TaxID=2606599 RepID=UPI00131EC1B3|nr:AEC family transporter [Alteribacillus sp. YIM 98480]
MNTMVPFLQEMLALYGMVVIGYLARKKAILNTHADHTLTQLVLCITLPALILFSMDISFSKVLVLDMVILVCLSVYILFLACVIGRFMRKHSTLSADRESVLEGLIIFGNQGFLGYAVAYIVFNEVGIVYATMFNVVYLILIWTYGIYLFVRSKDTIDWKSIFINPGIMAVMGGVVIFFAPFSWPHPVSSLLESIGKMTIPLSMILLGSLLKNVTSNDIVIYLKNKLMWQVAAVKLIIIPLLFIPVIYLFPISYPLITIAVLIAGMPSAPTISIYAKKYGGDAQFASTVVFFTTTAAFVTIPLLFFCIKLFY